MTLLMTRAEQEAMAAHEEKLASTHGKDLPGRPDSPICRGRYKLRMESDNAVIEAALRENPKATRRSIADSTGLSYERISKSINAVRARLGIPIPTASGNRAPRTGLRGSEKVKTHP